jgi:NADH:ubiquinone oxidoreductase subunit 4 (subunit M)
MILLGVFKAKLAIALLASSGVVMASVYALRLFIRAMHNRVGPKVESRELTPLDAAVLVPLLAVIVFLAIYPQGALKRSERSVIKSVTAAYAVTNPTPARILLDGRPVSEAELRRDVEKGTLPTPVNREDYNHPAPTPTR